MEMFLPKYTALIPRQYRFCSWKTPQSDLRYGNRVGRRDAEMECLHWGWLLYPKLKIVEIRGRDTCRLGKQACPLLQSSWGWGVFVRAACVPARVSCCAVGCPVSRWDGAEHHSTALSIPWLSPRCLLSPGQEAVTALRGLWWQNGGPGMPILSFCKRKAALCPNDRPLPHLWAFPELSQEHTPPCRLPQ